MLASCQYTLAASAGENSTTWNHATDLLNLDLAPGTGLHPGLEPVVSEIMGEKQMGDFYLYVSLFSLFS